MADETNKKKLVVLIEDEEILSNLLTQKLEKAGYQVKSAPDGEAGLKLILEAGPDLVLLDMLLPKLNGFGVLEKLAEQKLLPALPVIIISIPASPLKLTGRLGWGSGIISSKSISIPMRLWPR